MLVCQSRSLSTSEQQAYCILPYDQHVGAPSAHGTRHAAHGTQHTVCKMELFVFYDH